MMAAMSNELRPPAMKPNSDPPNDRSRRRFARAAKTASHFDISKSTLWHWAANRAGFPKPLRVGGRTTLFDLDAREAHFIATDTKGEG